MAKPNKDFLDKLEGAVNKKFGKGKAGRLSSSPSSEVTKVIPTGIDVLDNYVFGCGGLPVGRMVELFSAEGAGKTSAALSAMAEAQKEDALVVFAETEQAMPAGDRFKTFGVDPDGILRLDADCIEDTMGMWETVTENRPSGAPPILFIWDSLAATPTRAEFENGLAGKQKVAERARIMSQAIRTIAKKAVRAEVATLIINQTRQNIGVVFGNNVATPGGDAMKFYASIRAQILGGAKVVDGEYHIGKDVTFMACKNKMTVPWRKARVRLLYDTGWDNAWSNLNLAKDWGIFGARKRPTPLDVIEKLELCDWNPRSKELVDIIDAAAEITKK